MSSARSQGSERLGAAAVVLRLAGSLLALLAGAWVVYRLVADVERLAPDLETALVVLGLAVLYGAALLLPGASWWWLLAARGAAAGPTLAIWARANLAKYLPGNVFHLVGRQVLGKRLGMSQPTLALASLLETVCLLAAALVVCFVALLLGGGEGLGRGSVLLALAAVAVLGAVLLGRRLSRVRSAESSSLLALERLGGALLCDLLFMLVGSGVLALLVRYGFGHASVPLPQLGWAFVAAWLLGTIVPGAPAGLGIREAVLLSQLEPYLPAGEAGVIALALRVVTVGGDLLVGLLGWLGWRLGERD